MKDNNAISTDKPGFGVVLTDEIKRKYSFILGIVEFNPVFGIVQTTQIIMIKGDLNNKEYSPRYGHPRCVC